VSSPRRGCAGGGCVVVGARSFPASAGVLLSTIASKLSPRAESEPASDLAGLCGAPWKDTFDAASDVTLYTGGLYSWNWTRDQQGPGHPVFYKISI
jgi:hypothetical protein